MNDTEGVLSFPSELFHEKHERRIQNLSWIFFILLSTEIEYQALRKRRIVVKLFFKGAIRLNQI